MKNRHMLLMLALLLPVVSFGAAVGAGWAQDAECTLEEQGLGQCDRAGDAVNNAFVWLALVASSVAVLAGVGMAAVGGFTIAAFFGDREGNRYGDDNVASWGDKPLGGRLNKKEHDYL